MTHRPPSRTTATSAAGKDRVIEPRRFTAALEAARQVLAADR